VQFDVGKALCFLFLVKQGFMHSQDLVQLTIEIFHNVCGNDKQHLSDILLSGGAPHLMRAVEQNDR
jgi:hypothetical protein